MTALLSFLTGCQGSPKTPEDPSAADARPGELVGVIEESSGGSMEWRSEFEIEVNPQEIVRCGYWPEDLEKDMEHREHVPITAGQWAEIEKIVDTLYPLLEEVPEGKKNAPALPGVQILDGGDYYRLFLTWRTAQGDRTVRYYRPSDRRITTLDALLRELADPQGREIVWYDPPVLCGVYFRDESKELSYQCTEWDGPGTGYRYIAYYSENGAQQRVDRRVDAAVFEQANAFCAPLALKRFPEGSYKDKVTCTLYDSDHTQTCVKPDSAAAKALREGFAALTLAVCAGEYDYVEPITAENIGLSGAWEPNYVGPRAEISGNALVRLWRGAPVLETTFTLETDGEGYLLRLAETGLRYRPGEEPYAEIRECRYENGALTFTDFFPITGESTETLTPTQNNRYGNYEIVTEEVLPRLAGTWRETEGSMAVRFEGNTMFFGFGDDLSGRAEVAALRSRGDHAVYLHDADPSRDEVGMFGRIEVWDDRLSTYLPITDAPPAPIEFRRAED